MELSEARTIARDKARPLGRRVAATRALANSDEDADLVMLYELASAAVEPELSTAAGKSAARVLLRHGRPNDAPLHDFSGPAYVAFDGAVAESQAERAKATDQDPE